MPDILILLQALVDLCVAIVLYYVSAGLWDDVETQEGIISAWFSDLLFYISDTATQTVNAAMQVGGQYWETLSDLSAILQDYWERFINFFEGMYFLLDDFLFHPLWTYATEIFNLWPQVFSFIYNLPQSLFDRLGDTWVQIQQIVSDANAWIMSVIGDTWGQVVDFFSDPVAYVLSWLGDAWAWVISVFSDPAAWLFSLLGDTWQAIVNFLSDPASLIFAILGSVWQQVLDFFSDPAGFLMSLLPDVISEIIDFFLELGGVLVDFLSDPTTYILAALWDIFLPWLEQLIADNW